MSTRLPHRVCENLWKQSYPIVVIWIRGGSDFERLEVAWRPTMLYFGVFACGLGRLYLLRARWACQSSPATLAETCRAYVLVLGLRLGLRCRSWARGVQLGLEVKGPMFRSSRVSSRGLPGPRGTAASRTSGSSSMGGSAAKRQLECTQVGRVARESCREAPWAHCCQRLVPQDALQAHA